MQENNIIYKQERFSSFISDEGRREKREFFTPERDLHEPSILQNIFNKVINKENSIISIGEVFYSKVENTLIKIFNETKINDLFDDAFENRVQPFIFDYQAHPDRVDKSWQKLAVTNPVTLERLGETEVFELQGAYIRRVKQIAEKIAEIAKAQGATDEIDTDIVCKIIQLYQQRRENPKMDFFVNLAANGNKALAAHLDALSHYSPFTPEQIKNVFYAAADQKITPSVKRVFGNEDRLYYRMQVQGHNPTESKISAELENRGYKILSYEDGTAIKIDDIEEKQKYKIGKILKDNETLLAQFRDDPIRQMGQFLIVLSRNPDDIAKMSTDRAWVSCMASTGMMGTNNFHYVPNEIKQGALVAYVVKASDPNIYDPLSRILLKPYRKVRDFSDFKNKPEVLRDETIFIPGPNYGLPNQVFKDAIIGLAEQLNQGKSDGKYRMAEGCYEDSLGIEATVSGGQAHIEDSYRFLNLLQHNFQQNQNFPRLAA